MYMNVEVVAEINSFLLFIGDGPQSASELYRLGDRHLSTKFSGHFCG
jgi:hypothetical protein